MAAHSRPVWLRGVFYDPGESLREVEEEAVAGDHRMDASLGGDRDDQNPVVQEDLGQLGVRAVVLHKDLFDREVGADCLSAAFDASLDCFRRPSRKSGFR